ncbi:MAG: alpha/beta fold hydrolase [Pseudorhodoplanes sp.]
MLKYKFLNAGGVRTGYLDQGRGHPVVLIHGAAFGVDSVGSWYEQFPALSRGHRVVAFDQIGFGETDPFPGGRYLNRLQRVDHAIAFLEALNAGPATLVGHSEGAATAARIAILRPDLVASLVLLTSGGTAPIFGDARDRAWEQASAARYEYPDDPPAEDEFIARKKSNLRRYGKDAEGYWRAAYRRAIATNQYPSFRDMPESETDYRQYTRLQEEYIHPFLRDLKARTLLIWSKNDATVPVGRGVLLADMIPGADFYVLAEAGHTLMIDRAAAVNALLDAWCNAVSGARPSAS